MPSGHVNADQTLSLPFQGNEPVSRHCSHQGAVAASEKVGRQCVQLMTLYRQKGPQTDQEAADALGIQRSTVNARRAELVKRGLVQAVGTSKNMATGVNNTLWGLATKEG